MKADTTDLPLQAGTFADALCPSIKTMQQLCEAFHAEIQRDFNALSQRQPKLLQLALNEAAALAWWSKFPTLFFPTLAQEKVEAVARWDARQRARLLAEPSNYSTGVALEPARELYATTPHSF